MRARRWDHYIRGYETVLHASSTESAPCYVIPADHRPTRSALVSAVRVAELSQKGGARDPSEVHE